MYVIKIRSPPNYNLVVTQHAISSESAVHHVISSMGDCHPESFKNESHASSILLSIFGLVAKIQKLSANKIKDKDEMFRNMILNPSV